MAILLRFFVFKENKSSKAIKMQKAMSLCATTMLILTISASVSASELIKIKNINNESDMKKNAKFVSESVDKLGAVWSSSVDVFEKLNTISGLTVPMLKTLGPVASLAASLIQNLIPAPPSAELQAINKLDAKITDQFEKQTKLIKAVEYGGNFHDEVLDYQNQVTNPLTEFKIVFAPMMNKAAPNNFSQDFIEKCKSLGSGTTLLVRLKTIVVENCPISKKKNAVFLEFKKFFATLENSFKQQKIEEKRIKTVKSNILSHLLSIDKEEIAFKKIKKWKENKSIQFSDFGLFKTQVFITNAKNCILSNALYEHEYKRDAIEQFILDVYQESYDLAIISEFCNSFLHRDLPDKFQYYDSLLANLTLDVQDHLYDYLENAYESFFPSVAEVYVREALGKKIAYGSSLENVQNVLTERGFEGVFYNTVVIEKPELSPFSSGSMWYFECPTGIVIQDIEGGFVFVNAFDPFKYENNETINQIANWDKINRKTIESVEYKVQDNGCFAQYHELDLRFQITEEKAFKCKLMICFSYVF